MSAIMNLSELYLEAFLRITKLQNEQNKFKSNNYNGIPIQGVYKLRTHQCQCLGTKISSFTEERVSRNLRIMLTCQIFMLTCQLFTSICQIISLTSQKNIITTSSLISCFYIVFMPLTAICIYLSIKYLISQHHYLTSRHNY